MWEVKYDLEGYEVIYSDWLPVPPPQTDVNIGMVSLNSPKLEWANIYDNFAEISFSQYMNPNTLWNLLIIDTLGDKIDYILVYDDSETDNNGNVYAKNYKLIFNNNYIAKEEENYHIVLSDKIKNYANISIESISLNAKYKKTPSLVVQNDIKVRYGGSTTIPIGIINYSRGDVLECISGFDEIASVEIQESILDNGAINAIVWGNMIGETDIVFRLKDTSIFQKSHVVVTTDEFDEVTPVSGLTLNKDSIIFTAIGEKERLVATIFPENATNKAIIWKTQDPTIATVDENGLVTSKGVGSTNIIATTVDGEYSATCEVEVLRYSVEVKDVFFDNQNIIVNLNKIPDDLIGTIIVQGYDKNNKLLKLMYSNEGTLQNNYKFDFTNTSKPISHIKIFIWDSLKNMKLLTKVFQFNI